MTGLSLKEQVVSLGVKQLNRVGARLVERARETVDQISDGSLESISDETRKYLGLLVDALKRNNVIPEINVHNLPTLLDDLSQDRQIKKEILRSISTPVSRQAAFSNEIEYLSAHCFKKGVAPHRLITFFENEEMLNTMLKGVLVSPFADPEPTDLVDYIRQIWEKNCSKYGQETNTPVNKNTRSLDTTKIDRYMDFFLENYNPDDTDRNIQSFVSRIQEKHPHDHNILMRLKERKEAFIKLLRGYGSDEDTEYLNENKSYINMFVRRSYEKEAQKGKQIAYIDLMLPDIFHLSEDGKSLNLNLTKLRRLFEESFENIKKDKFSSEQLRVIFMNKCRDLIAGINTGPYTITYTQEVKKNKTTITTKTTLNDKESLICNFEKSIKDFIGPITEFSIRNFMADPDNIPEVLHNDYKRLYDEFGNIRHPEKRQLIRNLFELIPTDEEDSEKFKDISTRLSKIFKQADSYLEHLFQDLAIDITAIPKNVKKANSYHELVSIVCTTESKIERIAAQRKIALAFEIYKLTYNQRFKNREWDSKKTIEKLESEPNGIKPPSKDFIDEIRREMELYGIDHKNIPDDKICKIVRFIDHPDGSVEIMAPSKKDFELPEGAKIRELKLIPKSIAGVNCFVLPTDNSENQLEYTSIKQLFSSLPKMITRGYTNPYLIGDFGRTTILGKTIEDIRNIIEYFESNHLSFARTFKVNDRYNRFQKISGAPKRNRFTADSYRSTQLVINSPVPTEQGGDSYNAMFEIRIMLIRDLMLDKSHFNPAGHKNYEFRRSQEVFFKLFPPEVYPQFYKTEGPHEDDIFESVKTLVKKQSELETPETEQSDITVAA